MPTAQPPGAELPPPRGSASWQSAEHGNVPDYFFPSIACHVSVAPRVTAMGQCRCSPPGMIFRTPRISPSGTPRTNATITSLTPNLAFDSFLSIVGHSIAEDASMTPTEKERNPKEEQEAMGAHVRVPEGDTARRAITKKTQTRVRPVIRWIGVSFLCLVLILFGLGLLLSTREGPKPPKDSDLALVPVNQ